MKRMLTEEDKIRYKDDGESKEMAADSAKKLPDDHPAKKAWLAKQKGDSDDSGEKVKGADLFKSKEGEPKPNQDDEDDSGSGDSQGSLHGEEIVTTHDTFKKGDKADLNDLSDDNYGFDDDHIEKYFNSDGSAKVDMSVVELEDGSVQLTPTGDIEGISNKSDSPKDDDGGDDGGDPFHSNNLKDTPTIPQTEVDRMLNYSTDRNSLFSERTGIDLTQFKDMDEGGWGYLEDELIEKGIEPDNSFDINTDNEHGDPINVHVYGDFAVYVDSYTGNFNVTSKQDLAAGLKAIIGRNKSVKESFLSKTAQRLLSRRIR